MNRYRYYANTGIVEMGGEGGTNIKKVYGDTIAGGDIYNNIVGGTNITNVNSYGGTGGGADGVGGGGSIYADSEIMKVSYDITKIKQELSEIHNSSYSVFDYYVDETTKNYNTTNNVYSTQYINYLIDTKVPKLLYDVYSKVPEDQYDYVYDAKAIKNINNILAIPTLYSSKKKAGEAATKYKAYTTDYIDSLLSVKDKYEPNPKDNDTYSVDYINKLHRYNHMELREVENGTLQNYYYDVRDDNTHALTTLNVLKDGKRVLDEVYIIDPHNKFIDFIYDIGLQNGVIIGPIENPETGDIITTIINNENINITNQGDNYYYNTTIEGDKTTITNITNNVDNSYKYQYYSKNETTSNNVYLTENKTTINNVDNSVVSYVDNSVNIGPSETKYITNNSYYEGDYYYNNNVNSYYKGDEIYIHKVGSVTNTVDNSVTNIDNSVKIDTSQVNIDNSYKHIEGDKITYVTDNSYFKGDEIKIHKVENVTNNVDNSVTNIDNSVNIDNSQMHIDNSYKHIEGDKITTIVDNSYYKGDEIYIHKVTNVKEGDTVNNIDNSVRIGPTYTLYKYINKDVKDGENGKPGADGKPGESGTPGGTGDVINYINIDVKKPVISVIGGNTYTHITNNAVYTTNLAVGNPKEPGYENNTFVYNYKTNKFEIGKMQLKVSEVNDDYHYFLFRAVHGKHTFEEDEHELDDGQGDDFFEWPEITVEEEEEEEKKETTTPKPSETKPSETKPSETKPSESTDKGETPKQEVTVTEEEDVTTDKEPDKIEVDGEEETLLELPDPSKQSDKPSEMVPCTYTTRSTRSYFTPFSLDTNTDDDPPAIAYTSTTPTITIPSRIIMVTIPSETISTTINDKQATITIPQQDVTIRIPARTVEVKIE